MNTSQSSSADGDQLAGAHALPTSRRMRSVMLAGLLVFNVLVIGLSVDSLLRSRQQHEQSARKLTQNVTSALDLNVTKTIEKVDLALRSVVDELERQLASKGIDEKASNVFLAIQEQRLAEVEAFRVAQADGLVILGKSLVKGAGASWADRNDFIFLRDHPEAGLQITKPRLGRVARQYIVGFSRRFNHPDGSFAGIVSAPVAVDHFTRLLSQFDVGSKGTLLLRDAELGLITRMPPLPNHPAGQVGNQAVSDDFRRVFESGQAIATDFTSASPDGEQRIFTFHRMQAAPIVTIVATSRQDYLKGWTEEVYRASAMAGGFLLLSVLLGVSQLRLLRQAERNIISMRDNHIFVSNILDSLGEHVAVINGQGVITAVNASWRRFAAENGARREAKAFMGVNYLDTCMASAGLPSGDESLDANDGIKAVLMGTQRGFSLKYPCHSPTEQRWFILHVMPLMGSEQGAVLIHQNVTEQHQAEVQLRASEERYRLLADNVSDVIWVLDLAAHKFSYISPSVQQLRGYTAAEVMAQPPDAALTPESAASVRSRMQQVIDDINEGKQTKLQFIQEVDQPHRDGHVVHTEVTTRYLLDANGRPVSILGVTRNITARKQQELKLLASEEHFRMLAENMADIVWKADARMRFTYINDADRRIRGFEREEVLGFSIEDALTAEGWVIFANSVQKRRGVEASGHQSVSHTFELPMRRKEGGEVWIELSTISSCDSEGKITGFQGIGRDIDARRLWESQLVESHHDMVQQLQQVGLQKSVLQEQALRDSLTGLYNRRYLEETLPHTLSVAKRKHASVAIVMLDLDHFKRVNDEFGHAAGDEVLKALAHLLKYGARETDMICRYGGEEFVVIMPGMSAELARERIDSLRAELQGMTVHYGDFEIRITLSAGIAEFPANGDTPDTLLAGADQMLYHSKRAGRNRITVYQTTWPDQRSAPVN